MYPNKHLHVINEMCLFKKVQSFHQVGEADPSFFSVDCFHISERAHAEMAIALWNNMVRMEK